MANTVSVKRKRITIGVAATLMLAGAGVAFAYWTSTGTGTGAATTGSSAEFVITTDPDGATGTIAPGSVGQDIPFSVTHDGEGTQFLTGVDVKVADALGGAWAPEIVDCDVAAYDVELVDPVTGEITPEGSLAGTARVTLDNTTGVNQDGCKDLSVPLHFTAN